MNTGLLVTGIAGIAVGLFVMFNRGFMWTLTDWSNALKGVKSERTEAWDQMNGCTGGLFIVLGIVLIMMSFGGQSESHVLCAAPNGSPGCGRGHYDTPGKHRQRSGSNRPVFS